MFFMITLKQGCLTGGKFTPWGQIYPLGMGVNFTYQRGEFSELKTKKNFYFQYDKAVVVQWG